MTLLTAHVEPRLPAQDLERARRWYRDRLGLEPVEERPGGLRYATADGVFCLYLSAGRADGSFTQLSLEVADLPAEVELLRARGVEFLDYAGTALATVDGIATVKGNYPSKGTGERAAWFHDSEGNLIGLAQRLPARSAWIGRTSILLGTHDPRRLQRFYEQAFGVSPDANGWLRLGNLDVKIDGRADVETVNTEPGRVVLNVDVDDAASVVERMDALGAPCSCRLEERPNGLFSTFADPDGNVVQALQLTDAYRASINR